jgi:hypothetical protein
MLDNDPVKAFIIDSYLAKGLGPDTIDWAINNYYDKDEINKQNTWSWTWNMAYQNSKGIIPKKKEVKTERRIINPESIPTV